MYLQLNKMCPTVVRLWLLAQWSKALVGISQLYCLAVILDKDKQ